MANILSQIVEICVFRMVGTESEYLLLQRSPSDELYPNIWQIVTGTIAQNENAKDAALRELEEETGLTIKRFWVVPFVDSYFDFSKDSIQLAPVFAIEATTKNDMRLSLEHQRYEWLNYDAARERVVWPGHQRILDVVHKVIADGKNAANLSEITQE